jgi:hypothetical protein
MDLVPVEDKTPTDGVVLDGALFKALCLNIAGSPLNCHGI